MAKRGYMGPNTDYLKPKRARSERRGRGSGLKLGGKLPKLSDIKVPKGGLMNPSLRKDIGNVRGLSPAR